MKKLLLRFRRWLIKKLGGYIPEQGTGPVRKHTVMPVVVGAEVRVSSYDMEVFPANAERAIERAKALAAEAVIGQGLVKIERCDDPLRCEVKFRATVRLIPPDDFRTVQV